MSINPGVFIDIDGVLLQGGKPFEWSKEAIHVKKELIDFSIINFENFSLKIKLNIQRLCGTMMFPLCLSQMALMSRLFWPKA
jgi:hypothetical protein